jgi:hypothetical protein
LATRQIAEFKPGDHVTAKYVEAKLLGVNETASASGPIQKMSVASDNTVRGPTTIVSVDPANTQSPSSERITWWRQLTSPATP